MPYQVICHIFNNGQRLKSESFFDKNIPYQIEELKKHINGEDCNKWLIAQMLYDLLGIPKGLSYEIELIDRNTNETIFKYKW